jgi:hypothetical protein
LAANFGIGDDSHECSACGVSRNSDEGKENETGRTVAVSVTKETMNL